MNILKNVAAIIRTWSNNPDIAKAVNRALNAGIGHVIVVVKDDDPGHYGNVEAWLAGMIQGNAGRITLLPMRVGYSWSNALNYAFDEVREINLRAAVQNTEPVEFVLNVSNEALYTRQDLETMIGELTRDATIGAVGTTFEGRQNGNVVELGKSYIHPRNTMMLVRFAAYLAIGGYNPRCDHFGGQEDLDWIIRLEQMGQRWSMLDLKVKLLIGVNFNQAMKEAREMKAITAIMAMNAAITSGFAQAMLRLQQVQ